jgi:hypothetical protein
MGVGGQKQVLHTHHGDEERQVFTLKMNKMGREIHNSRVLTTMGSIKQKKRMVSSTQYNNKHPSDDKNSQASSRHQ